MFTMDSLTPAAPDPDPRDRDEGVLVETGEFRVARERALEKLRDYQLPDPFYGAFFWVRAAVASGATRLSLRRGLSSAELRFDGAPLSGAELKDPLAGIFGERGGRERQFAQGFLWLTRFDPASITVDSGGRRLTVNARGEYSVSASAGAASETVVRAEWKWNKAVQLALKPLWPNFRENCGESGLRITVSGKEIPPDPFAGHAVVREFSFNGARVRMSHHPRNSLGARFTMVNVFHLGARLKFPPHFFWHSWEPSLFVPCLALVGGDGVDADLSGFTVVRNEKLASLLERIRQEEKPLLHDLLRANETVTDLHLMSTLREAAFILKRDRNLPDGDPVMKRLWGAPIIPDESGRRWTLAEALENIDARRWKIGVHTLLFLEMIGGRHGKTPR